METSREVEISSTGVLVDDGGPAVSWGPIFAGGVAAMSVTVVLFMLGNGLGLSAASPWENEGASAVALTTGAAIWMVVTQWIASGLGGYTAGRLRVKWASLHADEVMFRDTSHGFLAWAAGTIGMALLAGLIALSAIGITGNIAGSVAGGAAQGAAQGAAEKEGQPSAYVLDMMFRPSAPTTDAAPAEETPAESTATTGENDTADAAIPAPAATAQETRSTQRMSMRGFRGYNARGEATTILVRGLADGEVSAEDRTYLVQLVATRTGLSEAEAQSRVDQTIAAVKADEVKAREAADKARKAAATASIVFALSLVIGAFIAAVAGAIGGRQRDEY